MNLIKVGLKSALSYIKYNLDIFSYSISYLCCKLFIYSALIGLMDNWVVGIILFPWLIGRRNWKRLLKIPQYYRSYKAIKNLGGLFK